MKKRLGRRTIMLGAAALTASFPSVRTHAADAPIRLRCSLDTPPSHARNTSLRDYLSRIETGSQGRIKPELFESGQLFPDLDIGKALIQNQVEMGVPGNWAITNVIPDADFFQHPALYGRSVDDLRRVVSGRPGQFLNEQIEKRLRVHVIGGWLELGFDNWYSATKPTRSVADLRNLKIRIPGGAGIAWRCQFVGALPNTTALPNVPLALSQGAIDGLIATDETISSMKLWDAKIRYSVADHQCMGEYIPIVSSAFWDQLPDDLRKLMTQTWQDNLPTYQSNMMAAQTAATRALIQNGITIAEPTPQEIDAERQLMMADADKLVKAARISAAMTDTLAKAIG